MGVATVRNNGDPDHWPANPIHAGEYVVPVEWVGFEEAGWSWNLLFVTNEDAPAL